MDGAEIAVETASSYGQLRGAGYTVQRTIDCLIATTCLANDHQRLHNDSNFDPFEAHLGLEMIHP